MRPVVLVLAATFALVVLVRWAIANGDRQTLVSGPDVIAEAFMQDILLRRGDPARSHLSGTEASRVSTDSLIGLGRVIRDIRPGRNAEATIQTIDSSRSIVRVEILFDDGSTSEFKLPLVWEAGHWRVSDLAPVESWISTVQPRTATR